MGKYKGFIEFERQDETNLKVEERLKNYEEFTVALSEAQQQDQAARCMDCGVPFCHSGCPLGNMIPDFNDAVFRGDWKEALEVLHATNNFPEFTGRLCPAPCESACVLGITSPPVAIEMIEKSIVERGFKEGWIVPNPPTKRTGMSVAVVGSGPAGLAAAQQLNRAGHSVTVFERDDKIGGLLRYGIPNFKLEKDIIDRRVRLMEAEGIKFKTNIDVGNNFSVEKLMEFDATVLAIGATIKRKLPITGSRLKGVIQAMDFLKKQNKVLDRIEDPAADLSATGKHVIVIGGGDTGSDCIGTSNRQGARSVTNFEIMAMPSEIRSEEHPWPYWPFTLKTTSSHEEGVERNWAIATKEFIGNEQDELVALKTVEVEWISIKGERPQLKEIPGTEKEWPCDMAILALGFTGAEATIPEQLSLAMNERNSISTNPNDYQTSLKNVFVAGDARRGQSLIVWAISEGREAARQVDEFLMGTSTLPTKEKGDLPAVAR